MSVPHASEEFRDYLFWTDLPTNESRYWSGAAPRLDTPDGDARAAYAEVGSGAFTTVTVTLEPFALTRSTLVSTQVRTLGVFAGIFEMFAADSSGTNYVFWVESVGSSWESLRRPLSSFTYVDEFWPGLVAAAAAGELVVGVLGPLGVGEGYAVSWLDLSGDIPLRLRQRGDGLGMGGPRLFGRGSRQRSPRARGYL